MILSPQDKEFILQNEKASVADIALSLSKGDIDKERINFLLNQIVGRQLSKRKILKWHKNGEIIYPPHLSVEQASSEDTAKFKASLIKDNDTSFIDLTGGFGVDFSYFAEKFKSATYIEQNKELCEIAKHNFIALGLNNINVVNGNSEDFLASMLDVVDVIYLDPARRGILGNRVFRIEDCSPNVIEIQELLLNKSSKIIIKYSPMLDISSALKVLDHVSDVYIVSVDNECKELLFIISKSDQPISYNAINIRKNNHKEEFSFIYENELSLDIPYTDTILRYLYEPNVSILKAGAYKTIAQRFNLNKLHPNSHLYTSDLLIEDFPGRRFEVKHSFPPNKNNLKQHLSKINKANISIRNYPMSVDEIRSTMKLHDGGDIYIFATTIQSGKKVWIICDRI